MLASSGNLSPVLLALMALVALAGPQVEAQDSAHEDAQDSARDDARDDAREDVREDALPFDISGSLNQRYRFRRSGGENDQDLYGYLNLDAAYPKPESAEKRPYGEVGVHIQGSYNLDIDSFEGASDQRGFVPFTDITNTFGDRFHAFLNSAYLEVTEVSFLEHFRVGRQLIYREDGILFDGGHAKTREWKTLSFDVYGGVPAHLYESSPSGDALAGVGVESNPIRDLVVGADYFFIRDRRDDGPNSNDNLYLIRGNYRLNDQWFTNASASWVDSRDRRQLIDLRYLSKERGTLVYFRALRQNSNVNFISSELSTYKLVEGRYAPHYQFQLDAHQPIGEHFGVGGGVSVRQLENSSEEDIFNHEFQNFYVALDAEDLWEGGKVSLRGDFYNSDDDDISEGGFEIEQEVAELLRIRAGTSYSLYRFDEFTGTERNRSRVYYLRLRWKLRKSLHLDTDYRYEKDSDTEYHVVTTGFRLWF